MVARPGLLSPQIAALHHHEPLREATALTTFPLALVPPSQAGTPCGRRRPCRPAGARRLPHIVAKRTSYGVRGDGRRQPVS